MTAISSILGTKYSRMIAQPEWDVFRRRILSRSNCCELCRLGNRTLQVHHWFYDSRRKAWEYADDEVAVACKECHHEAHVRLAAFRQFVVPRLGNSSFRILTGSIAAALTRFDGQEVALAIAHLAAQPETLSRFADAGRKDFKI